jgi:hypothetical protein
MVKDNWNMEEVYASATLVGAIMKCLSLINKLKNNFI